MLAYSQGIFKNFDNVLPVLMEKIDNMKEQLGNSREMKTQRKITKEMLEIPNS